MERVLVIGGGLAGSEAAWQAARHGVKVTLFEMRLQAMTPAHQTGDLAELVTTQLPGSAHLKPSLLGATIGSNVSVEDPWALSSAWAYAGSIPTPLPR